MEATDFVCHAEPFLKHILKDAIQVIIISHYSYKRCSRLLWVQVAFALDERCHSCYNYWWKYLLCGVFTLQKLGMG